MLAETQNPAVIFLDRNRPVENSEDVIRYVRFLRHESGVSAEPPVDLTRIYQRFGLPLPARTPLPVQGLLMDAAQGLILVNSDDPTTRQRFSEAHELVEMLFVTADSFQRNSPGRVARFKSNTKERLCNEGASELLMPYETFAPRAERLRVSFASARNLADEYNVSATAALVRMTQVVEGTCSVVLWRMKHKPSEMRPSAAAEQLSLFPNVHAVDPPKKLRVEWAIGNGNLFVPKDKSVSDDTTIYAAWRDGRFTYGTDQLDLGSFQGMADCESQPFEQEGERLVLSLLHVHEVHPCLYSSTASELKNICYS